MSGPIPLHAVDANSYRGPSGHTLTRGNHIDAGGNYLTAVWVLRDPDGLVLGHDRYRHDLEARCGIRLMDSTDPTATATPRTASDSASSPR